MKYCIIRRINRFGYGSGHTWCRACRGYLMPIAWYTDHYLSRERTIMLSKAEAMKLMRELQDGDSKHEYRLYKAKP